MKSRITQIVLFLLGVPVLVMTGLIHAGRDPRAVKNSSQNDAPSKDDSQDSARPKSKWGMWIAITVWTGVVVITALGVLVSVLLASHDMWPEGISVVLTTGGLLSALIARYKRIPNWLIFALYLFGIALGIISLSMTFGSVCEQIPTC